jgi:hypothetical protein
MGIFQPRYYQYDIYIAYRDRSDSESAQRFYQELTKLGYKVFLDKKCLNHGVPWDQVNINVHIMITN